MRNYPNINELFPWASILPVEDRILFDKEIKETLDNAEKTNDYEGFSVLLNDWKTTADVWADEKLVKSLLEAINEEFDSSREQE